MLLAEHFAIGMARELELELFSGFTAKAKKTLLEYDWPGNVRELKNVVERAVYRTNPNLPVHDIVVNPFLSEFRPQQRIRTPLQTTAVNSARQSSAPVENNNLLDSITQSSDEAITAASASATEKNLYFPIDLKEQSQDFEIHMLNSALKDAQFNQKKTAEKLSLTYHQLRGYLKKYNLLDKTDE
jgi:psp operon transcriptional activator